MLTKSGLVILLLLYSGAIFVLYSLAFGNGSFNNNPDLQTQVPQQNITVFHLGILGDMTVNPSNIGLFQAFIIGISSVPAWLTTIIFTPVIGGLLFIFITSLPTFNGGS